MALTDMKEALLNNSYDYEPTGKVLTETWENSYSYLLALQQAYVKYEYFEAISGNDPDDGTLLDWNSTRDRKIIGHMYVDQYNNVKFDVDYDLIHLNRREAFRKSGYYQKKFSMDDIMFRSDIFLYMPIVFIDDKIQWDYTMKVTEEGTEFTTMFDRGFIIERERTWDDEKQEYSDIIYKTHKLQVFIIETKYAWRFKSKYSDKAYPQYALNPLAKDGPFKILSDTGEVVFEPNHSSNHYEDTHILETWNSRFADFVKEKRVSAFWQKPLNGWDAPAAIDNVRFEAIDKRGGTYVKPTSVDGLPEFFVEKYTTNPDGTSRGYMTNVSGTERIDMLTKQGKKNVLYPYFSEAVSGKKCMSSDSGTLFFALQFPNEYGKEWWYNGTTLFPMEYDSESDTYKGALSDECFNYLKDNSDKEFFIIFIYIDELKRISIPCMIDDNIGRTENGQVYEYSIYNDGERESIVALPPFEVGKSVLYDRELPTKTIFKLFNMPVPTTNFIIKFKDNSETIAPMFYRSEDLLDIHYPNFYTWKMDKLSEIIEGYGSENIRVEIYMFYHEDDDHKYLDIFDFYRKYLLEAYKETDEFSIELIDGESIPRTDYREDEIIFALLHQDLYPDPIGDNLEARAKFDEGFASIYFDYKFNNYQYGESDYLHVWLKEHPLSNPVEYKIEKLKDWIKWDSEALRTYVLKQNRLGSRYGLFCCDINMGGRLRTDTFREMADRDYEYVFIENNDTIAYEAVQNPVTGEWEYKLDDGEKVEVLPDTDVAYIDCGSASIPCRMYRWTGETLPGRTPHYIYQTTIRYFRDKDGNPEYRYVFSMNNSRPYPLLLDARIFVNGLMVVDVYQERKLFLDYFYIPAKYFTINNDGSCDDYIEIEIFPSFDMSKSVRFESPNDEKTFLIFEPTSEDYYNQIAPNASQDYKSIPMYEKIEHSEEVYIKPVTPDYTMKDGEGNLYVMNEQATYTGYSDHQGDFSHLYYDEVLAIRNTMYDEEREVIIGYDDDGNPITEMQIIPVPDNVYITEIEHTYRVTSSTGVFIKNITYEEFVRMRDNKELTPYNPASWKQLTEAYYERTSVTYADGRVEYLYDNPVFPREDTIYKELSGDKPYKWYFWDGFRFVYYDHKSERQDIWPTVMDLYFRDTYDDPEHYQYNQRFSTDEATITEIYDDGEYVVTDRDTTKNPHEFTRLEKFKIKPKTASSQLIDRDLFLTIHKRPISYEVVIDAEDGKTVTYVVLEINDKNFFYDAEYIRLYVNGRLLSPLHWKLVSSFDSPRIYIMTPLCYDDRVFIDITPYRYKHIYHKDEFDPMDEIVDLKGVITKPFDSRYYDVYLNGRKLNINNITNINPWSITLTNMKSKYDLDIYERERDWEYYGIDYLTNKYPYSLDELLKEEYVHEIIKYKIVIDLINDKKDDRYKVVPNVNIEERWNTDVDYREWAEMEIFYYDELLPKSYMNPDRLQFNNILMQEDYTVIHENFTIDPVSDSTNPEQIERRTTNNHPKVVMLDPDLCLAHPEDVPYPSDPEDFHTIAFSVGHPYDTTDPEYLNEDISDKLNYDSNI